MHVIIFDRQHIEAAQATIFFLSESDDSFITSVMCVFQEMCVLTGPLFLVNTTVYWTHHFLTDIDVATDC